MRQQTVTMDRNGDGYLVTYSTLRNGMWHRGRGDRYETEAEMIVGVQNHIRNMEQMGYQVTVEDNTV